jgi:hypothetical protein
MRMASAYQSYLPSDDMVHVQLAEALAGCRVLIAYGLLGEVGAALRPFGVDYMGTQAAWLRDTLPADVSVVRLPTGAPIAANAARLRAILLADPRPALIIAHSKGGLESLAALVHADAAARCCGLITIQSPFYGSLVADAVVASKRLHFAAGAALRAMRRGSALGIFDLTVGARTVWMAENAKGIAAALRSFPVVNCASRVDIPVSGPDRRYLPLVRWMERRGAGGNDGFVSISSALLPGARHVVVSGTHRGLTAKGAGRDPVGLLRGLLVLALLREDGIVTNHYKSTTLSRENVRHSAL